MIVDLLYTLAKWLWLPLLGYTTIVLYTHYISLRIPPLPFPTISPSDHGNSHAAAIRAGTTLYPTTPFIFPLASEPLVILPMSLFPHISTYPETSITMIGEVYRRFLGRYTHLGSHRPEVISTVRQDLTRNLGNTMNLVQDETFYALNKEIGRPEDWTAVPLYMKLLRIVAMVSGRLFVGLPLSREEDWMNISIMYTVDAVTVHDDAGKYHPLLRPIVGPFLPSVRKVRKHQDSMRKWMRPLMAEVLERRRSGKPVTPGPEGLEERGVFISWLLNHLPAEKQNEDDLSVGQLLISFAAIHTTSTNACATLFDLASRPEYIEELREEMEEVARADGLVKDEKTGIRVFPKTSIAKLWKLDSFIKESQRMSPMSYATPTRRVLHDITLPNGIKLPKNAKIAFSTWSVHTSEETETFSPAYNAPTVNAPPDVFDGLRFYRLRKVEGRERKHQVVTTSTESLTFGHGPHACPGRFFATYEVKAIIMAVIESWDIRCEGEGNPRPKDIEVGVTVRQNPRAMLEVRRRQT